MPDGAGGQSSRREPGPAHGAPAEEAVRGPFLTVGASGGSGAGQAEHGEGFWEDLGGQTVEVWHCPGLGKAARGHARALAVGQWAWFIPYHHLQMRTLRPRG